MRAILIALALGFGALRAEAQLPALADAAERARAAWLGHDVSGLLAESPKLLMQLPGTDPSVALGPEQAAAMLVDFLSQASEVETVVRAAREVEPGRGYVELERKYRIQGTQEVRIQSLLLGYRQTRSGWVLVELRVVS